MLLTSTRIRKPSTPTNRHILRIIAHWRTAGTLAGRFIRMLFQLIPKSHRFYARPCDWSNNRRSNHAVVLSNNSTGWMVYISGSYELCCNERVFYSRSTEHGPSPAAFTVYAFYSYSNTVFGINTNLPLVGMVTTNLNAQQGAQIQLQYFDGNSGGSPSALSPISLCVLWSEHVPGTFSSDLTIRLQHCR